MGKFKGFLFVIIIYTFRLNSRPTLAEAGRDTMTAVTNKSQKSDQGPIFRPGVFRSKFPCRKPEESKSIRLIEFVLVKS